MPLACCLHIYIPRSKTSARGGGTLSARLTWSTCDLPRHEFRLLPSPYDISISQPNINVNMIILDVLRLNLEHKKSGELIPTDAVEHFCPTVAASVRN